MAWAKILMALIGAAGALAKYLSDRQLITLAEAATAADALKRVQDALRAGNAVDVSPGGLRKHDVHERVD